MAPSSEKSHRSFAKGNSASKARTSPTGKAVRGRNVSRRSPSSGANVMRLETLLESRDFKEFIESLNSKGVEYLIVGGYAVSFHGYPRYTGDMDVWVGTSKDNAMKLVLALKDFGMDSLGLKAEDFVTPDTFVQLGYAPYRIDIITTLSDAPFSDCLTRAVVVKREGVTLRFIGLDDLKQVKRLAGRPKDLIDLENLQ